MSEPRIHGGRPPTRRSDRQMLRDLFGEPLEPGYAQAAAARVEGGGTGPGRSRRMVALATVAVVGLLLAIAYQQMVTEAPGRAQVRADLERQIHDRQAETQLLQTQADQLRDEVAALRDQQLGDPAAVRRLRELEAVTGLGRVHGDGVRVRVDDGPAVIDPATGAPVLDPQARILYRDLQQLANALWAAGAEAVAINDRRLTAISTIRSASGAILIDRTPVARPYQLVAVGPDDLAERFADSQAAQLMELLVGEFGIEYELSAESDLSVPAAAEPQLRHATPVTGSP